MADPIKQSYPITGEVRDSEGRAMADVSMYMINTSSGERCAVDPGTNDDVLTNAEGVFALNAASFTTSGWNDGDSIEVFAEKDGYAIDKAVIVIDEGSATTEVNFVLKPFNIEQNSTVREVITNGLSKAGEAFQVWVENYQADAATPTVIASSGSGWGKGVTDTSKPLVTLRPGETAYVEQITIMPRTASKVIGVEVVKCAGDKGTGTSTKMSGTFYAANGTLVEAKPYTIKFANPVKISYQADHAQSVAFRVAATDTSTYFDVTMEGHISH